MLGRLRHLLYDTGIECAKPNCGPPSRPRSSFNDDACQNCHISTAYSDAQKKLLWRDKTCPARTQLIMG